MIGRFAFKMVRPATIALLTGWFCSISADSALGQNAVGIRNFRQLVQSLSAVTGVPPNDATVRAEYNRVLSRLPSQGDVGELGTQTLLAVASLSGAYCDRMIAMQSGTTDPEARRFFRDLDFGLSPSQVPQQVKVSMIRELGAAFWQRMLTPREESVLMTSFEQGVAMESDTPAALRAGILRVCGAVAASLESIAY